MEINNLPDAEFKTLVIRMLKELSVDLKSITKNKTYNQNSKKKKESKKKS